MACENGVFNTWTGYASKKYDDGRTGCNGINNNATIDYSSNPNKPKYHVIMLGYMCSESTTPPNRNTNYFTDSIEDAMKKAQAWADASPWGGVGGVHDRTGDYCANQAPAEPEEEKGLIKQVADFFFPPPQEPPMIHEESFIPEVQPEIQPEVGLRIPPPPPKKAPPSAFDGQMKPLAPPPMHEPIIGYDMAGNPIYDTPPPMDWGQIPIIGPIMDAMKGIPVNGESPVESEDKSHEDEARLEQESRIKTVDSTDYKHSQAVAYITEEGKNAWDGLRAKYIAGPPFVSWNYEEQLKILFDEYKIPKPVDCIVDIAPWDEHGWVDNCDTHGTWVRARQRPVSTTPPQHGGKDCPRYDSLPPSIEERPCDPVDAKWEWSDWSEPCAESSQYRDTILISHAKHGGQGYGAKHETRPCEMPVDCEIEWEDIWSPCADGIQHRNANILTKPKFGGKECDFLQETRECEMPPEPIDCVMGDWTDWTDCANGQQERTRKQVIDPQHGGVPCNEMTYESRECQMPVVAEPTPEPEPVPDETPSAGATTVVDEPEDIPCCPECPEGANCAPCHPASVPCEPTIVEVIVNPIVDVIIGTGEALLGWIDMGGGLEDTVTIPSQPVQVDAGTGQDSLLPVQTTPVPETVAEPEPTPAETEETPPPADDTSTGGGGAPVITPAETTEEEEEEETEVEKCEDKNRETNADGSCGASCKDGHDWDSTEADAKCVCVEGCWKKWAMYGGLLAGLASGGYYYFGKRKG